MDTELTLDVGQANEFKLACRRAGYTNMDIKRMCEGDVLARILPIVRGNGEVTLVRHIIDCDADPFVPDGWKVEEHEKGGQFEWDPTKIQFHLSPNQMDGKVIEGNKLRKELAPLPTLNANILDYLLAHPDLIPEDWKRDERGYTRYIFFWGTIYRRADGSLYVGYRYFRAGGGLYVRRLCFRGGRWDWNFHWLDLGWLDDYPAARLAS